MGERAPEEAGTGEPLDIVQDRGARRRKAGDGLKKGVDKARDIAAEHKGQRAEQRHEKPGQPDRGKALAREDLARARAYKAQKAAQGRRERKRHGKGEDILPVNERRCERQQKQHRHDLQHPPEDLGDHSYIHLSPPVMSLMSRSMPAGATTTAWSPLSITVEPLGIIVFLPRVIALISTPLRR